MSVSSCKDSEGSECGSTCKALTCDICLLSFLGTQFPQL